MENDRKKAIGGGSAMRIAAQLKAATGPKHAPLPTPASASKPTTPTFNTEMRTNAFSAAAAEAAKGLKTKQPHLATAMLELTKKAVELAQNDLITPDSVNEASAKLPSLDINVSKAIEVLNSLIYTHTPTPM